MAGGGNRGGWHDAVDIATKLRNTEVQRTSQEFEAAVSQFLGELLSGFGRDTDLVRRLLDKVETELSDELSTSLDLRFGGSVAKHTYVDGLSDVDALVVVSGAIGEDISPEALRRQFADRLSSRFGREAVSEGDLAVTLRVRGLELQLLPALPSSAGYKISSENGKHWAEIDPKGFADALTAANTRLNGRLVPVIKLAKSLVADLPEIRRPSGYHLEALGVAIARKYDGPMTTKALLAEYFSQAAELVKRPIRDSTGQSIHVDDDLGPEGHRNRLLLSDSLAQVARRIRNANGASSLDAWRKLFA